MTEKKTDIKKNRNNKKLIVLIIAIGIVIAGAIALAVGRGKSKEEVRTTASPSAVTYLNDSKQADGDYTLDDATIQNLRNELASDQQVNGDTKALFYFESGLVKRPLMQTGDYYYLFHSYETKAAENAKDCVTLDPDNNLNKDDMNLHVAAHYWYDYQERGAESYGFTPLVKLQDQANYDANKYVTIVTPTEIRYYQIAYVVNCPLDLVDGTYYPPNDLQYNLISYDSDYFKEYINAVKENEYYDTGVNIDYGDRMLTMETCIQSEEDHREIVIAKEIGRTQFQ